VTGHGTATARENTETTARKGDGVTTQDGTARDETTYAPGARILARDEEWLVRNSETISIQELEGRKILHSKIKAIGISPFVQDEEATFFTELEPVSALRPEDTILVADPSSRFRRSRLFLEAVIRKTPLPQSELGLALPDAFLLDAKIYQQRPAELALRGLRPRILIADVVGLGKTLEIGLLLAELIRRGRGDRILVVTPQHVLEQFQHELWTRFSIPLVRLDSVGISRIQQRIPAGRNPFTHYKRVIISIDTLKNRDMYKHHLESIHWDAVVIDESHNLIGEASLRNQLAKVLAPRTDALILASATPHNGDKKSFAELINLLDPAAIADKDTYSAEQIAHLYIRRMKISPEVRNDVGKEWANRGPSVPVYCPATPAEETILEELSTVWLAGDGLIDQKRRLFPYTLFKSFLSSHRALATTVITRLHTMSEQTSLKPEREALGKLMGEKGSLDLRDKREAVHRLGEKIAPNLKPEWDALALLGELAGAMTDDDSAKLARLVALLKEIGVGPRSDRRAVVFSERIATLKWLAEVVPPLLDFTDSSAVRRMDGTCSDIEQMEIINEFGRGGSPVRLLFTGDVASEGVNLHKQCHHLIHYDLPWSLIRIEQRNGRIDRYGQREQPQFHALMLTSQKGAKDDNTVSRRLLEREATAHASLGSAEAVTGLYRADKEERRLIQDLLAGKTVDQSLDESTPLDDGWAALMSENTVPTVQAPERAKVPKLFAETSDFVDEAIREVYGDQGLNLERDADMFQFTPPPDLWHRLSLLPPSYLKERNIREKLRLTFDKKTAQERLDLARNDENTIWPDIAYLSDIHPVVEWLVDKVLVRLGRQQAPVIVAEVAEPVFLVQGIYSNAHGKPTVVAWMAVTGLPGAPVVQDMFETLERAGVGPRLSNTNETVDLARLQTLVESAVHTARRHSEERRAVWDAKVAAPLEEYRSRLAKWQQDSLPGLPKNRDKGAVVETAIRQEELVNSLMTTGEPLIRVLAVLAGKGR